MVAQRPARPPRPTDDVRPRALAAATRLFAARGFEGASLQDVAGEVGVTKQALLYHFASKEELRRAVLGAMVTHWNEALPRVLLAASAADDRFDAVVGELLRFFASDPDRARLLVRHLLDRPAESRELIASHVKGYVAAISSYIARGRERGTHRADVDPEAYVAAVLQLLVVGVASLPVLDVVLDGPRAKAAPRVIAELRRIARVALFPAEAPAPAPRRPTRTRSTARTARRGDP
ncbi:MAG: TetR/AcrR family transcriptional regulator [Polyangiaceae bacterium]|nr:TetR/AcrR family transcriptional regulator [Polyangiaceae bacterium]